ncbi:hypothetical protein LUZ61_014263 [Rhynchospora tenuis]|uniref:O-methyltransferase n=1 Tax=Rhynchospora tenuis TaxID=198213 RepID=A0AAD5WAZ7_9POAL|nr:hypothetical protein LUZ61_014263 [Rhynchospora tenuis]
MESQNILNAQAELWNQTFSFVKSLTLKCAIELGIPNAIHSHGQPMTLSELHAALSLPTCNETNLLRLVRMLTHSGFLVQNTGKNSEEVYDLTPISRLVINNSDSTSSLSSFVLGDMFNKIPRADAVFLKWILHDWCDEDCIKILQRCKEAIPSKEAGGKVIIVDMVVGSDVGSINHEPQLLFDMMMMTLTKGKEREENEWSNLFKKAGFNSYKIAASLGVRSIIEVYP